LSLLYDERDKRLQYLISRAFTIAAVGTIHQLGRECRDLAPHIVSTPESFYVLIYCSLFQYHQYRLEDIVAMIIDEINGERGREGGRKA
jgi:hypothetical protein